MAAEYINKISGVKSFKNLPKSGNGTKHIVKGEIYSDKEHKKKKVSSKAKNVDFYFKYGLYDIFVSHKYTKDTGGGQVDFKRELNGVSLTLF